MILYDFWEDYPVAIPIALAAILVVFIVVIISIIRKLVKIYRVGVPGIERRINVGIGLVPVAIVAAISIFFFVNFVVPTFQMYEQYASKTYLEARGTLTDLQFERDDYRGAEEYALRFSVGEEPFEDLINRFSKDYKDLLSTYEGKEVKVYYNYVKDLCVLYQVEVDDSNA